MGQLDEYFYPVTDLDDIEQQVKRYLSYFDKADVFEHSKQVAIQAKELAKKFDLATELAYQAGLLHDISAVIPNEKRIAVQKEQDETIYSFKLLPS